MNGQNQEPMTDEQLSALLKKWIVVAPEDLESRVVGSRAGVVASEQKVGWWRFLLKGSIRIPVPVACCLALLMIVIVWRSATIGGPCVAFNGGMNTTPSIAAGRAPAHAGHFVGFCQANTKC